MNEHLLIRSRTYAEFRRRQLVHVNLWPLAQWKAALHDAGFGGVTWRPYLTGGNCRLWDTIDLPGSLGFGRYRVATATKWVTRRMLSPWLRARARALVARYLRYAARKRVNQGSVCAVVLEAHKLQDR